MPCGNAAKHFPATIDTNLFPSNSARTERHHRQISAKLASIFSHSNWTRHDSFFCCSTSYISKSWKTSIRLSSGFVTASTLYDGIVLQRAFAAVTAPLHRQEKEFASLAACAVSSKRRHRPAGEEIQPFAVPTVSRIGGDTASVSVDEAIVNFVSHVFEQAQS